MSEHRRATKNKQFKASLKTQSEPGHTIPFDDAKIIAKEGKYFPRIIRGAIEIITRPDHLNRETLIHSTTRGKKSFRAHMRTFPDWPKAIHGSLAPK
jgi:hypothetical protein